MRTIVTLLIAGVLATPAFAAGTDMHLAVFRENDIDDTVLPNPTVEDLKELGVASLGHRRKILDWDLKGMAGLVRAWVAEEVVNEAWTSAYFNVATWVDLARIFEHPLGVAAILFRREPF
jgi:hypothetical protein